MKKLILITMAGLTAAVSVDAKHQPKLPFEDTLVNENAPRAKPITRSYVRADGVEVPMSKSQFAIINDYWRKGTAEEIARIGRNITVTVLLTTADDKTYTGTGFFINANQILTNWHMVRDAKHISVMDSTGHTFDGNIQQGNQQTDLAIINVPAASNKNWAAFVTDSYWEQQGEKVYVYGNPRGMDGTFVAGMLSSMRNNWAVFQIAAPLDHGSSGSPIFNEYGLVIGILSRGMDNSQAEICFALSTNAIFDSLNVHNDDHPNGFKTGVTAGLDIRSQDEIDFDKQANAAKNQSSN